MVDVSKIIPKDLDPNKEYVVRVRSVNPLGTKSEWSRGLYVDTSRTSSAVDLFTQTDNELSVLSRDGQVIFGTYAVEGIRNNLIANPSFETNMTGWTALSACTVATAGTEFVYGSNSAEITPAGGITSNEDIGLTLAFSNYATVTTGKRYTLSLYVYREYDQSEHGGVNEEFSHVRLKANLYDLFDIKGVVEASEPIRIPNNEWTRLHVEDILIPTGYSASPKMGLTVQLDDSPDETIISVNEKLYVDAVLLEEATKVDSYFDGDTVPGLTSWDGTANASTSTFDNPAAGSVFFRGSLTVGGVIRSDNYSNPLENDFSNSGTELDLSTGRFRAPNFGIKDNGDALFNGTIDATDGSIGGWTINSGSLSKGNTVLTGSGTNGSIATTDFILKNGTATRGTWESNEPFGIYSNMDGLFPNSVSSTVTCGLVWPTVSNNSIWLANTWSGSTGRTQTVRVDYDELLLSSVEHNAPNRSSNMFINESQIELNSNGQLLQLSSAGVKFNKVESISGYLYLSAQGTANLIEALDWMKIAMGPDVGTPVVRKADGVLAYDASKRELKDLIEPFSETLASSAIDAMEPVSYIWKDLSGNSTEASERFRKADSQLGFIAEDMAVIDSRLAIWELDKDDDDNPTGGMSPINWNMKATIAVLVKEVQGLRQRVKQLES